ncbi:hypothetical protein JCM11491_004783 [Sporobolomyces phaffii]
MLGSNSLLSLAALVLAGIASVHAQTATTISDEMNALVVNIPEACLDVCSPWRQAYQQCPVASDASTAYSTCTCATSFVNNFNACTGCMANTFNAEGDATDAQTATQAPADLGTYCAAAGLAESSSSSTTSSVMTSTSTTDPAAVTTTTDSSASTSSSSSSSAVSSSSTASGIVGGAGGPASAGGPFPSQTKQPSAFTNAGTTFELAKLSGGVVVGLFSAMMML